jgi:hypothetical protein
MPSRPQQFHARPRQTRANQNAIVDAERGSSRERGYTGQWDRASRLFRLHHPICKGCEAVGLVTPSEVTDHVEPHKGDQTKFWNRDMWQSACCWHHDIIKQKLEVMWSKGEIVTADLWLDSQAAIRLTLAELPVDVGVVGGRQKFNSTSRGPAV